MRTLEVELAAANEAARVADAFHVDQDALRGGVAGQEVQHLRQFHRGVGPERHHGGEAHAVVARPVQHGRGERARLRHQRQRARRGQCAGGAGVELEQRPLETQAVGPQQVHAVPLGDGQQLGAERASSIYVMSLFGDGTPAKTVARLAGLPKPTNCI